MKKTFIIAEAGVNHNGSLDMAKELINVAVEAGADAVKFQTFRAEELASEIAPKAKYQIETTSSTESQFQMLKKLELSFEVHHQLIDYCCAKNIQFLSTPFDFPSVKLLTDTFDLPIIKIPSGEITNAPLLLEIAKTKRKMILSTGMSMLGEIEQALSVLAYGLISDCHSPSQEAFNDAFCSIKGQEALKKYVSLLHCTTGYPTPFSEVNLRVIDTLTEAFGLPVGFSDHSVGITVPIAAVARGAKIIEKHFTLDKNLPGPDHKASLEPNELKEMVQAIRETELALGQPYKIPTVSEQKNKGIARKSIVATRNIQKGEVFSPQNISVKRPGSGISPFLYWELLSKKATKDYDKDDLINE